MDFETLKRFINDECTPEEIEEIKELSRTTNDAEVIDHLVEKGWYKAQPDDDKLHHLALFEKIKSKKSQNQEIYQISPKPVKKDMFYLSKIAASIAIFIGVFFAILQLDSQEQDEIHLPEIKWITKSTNWGEKLTIKLPDNSTVTLNSGSTIRYLEVFEDFRKVEIDGEAFFSVKKDKVHPFIVNAGKVETTVLGTEFNINSRNGTCIALVEGSVEVKYPDHEPRKLQPTEKISRKGDNLIVEFFEEPDVIGWKSGEITFRNESFRNVISQLERFYGVEIEIGKLIDDDTRISGTFPNQNLESIIQGLCYSFKLKYKFDFQSKKVFLTLN